MLPLMKSPGSLNLHMQDVIVEEKIISNLQKRVDVQRANRMQQVINSDFKDHHKMSIAVIDKADMKALKKHPEESRFRRMYDMTSQFLFKMLEVLKIFFICLNPSRPSKNKDAEVQKEDFIEWEEVDQVDDEKVDSKDLFFGAQSPLLEVKSPLVADPKIKDKTFKKVAEKEPVVTIQPIESKVDVRQRVSNLEQRIEKSTSQMSKVFAIPLQPPSSQKIHQLETQEVANSFSAQIIHLPSLKKDAHGALNQINLFKPLPLVQQKSLSANLDQILKSEEELNSEEKDEPLDHIIEKVEKDLDESEDSMEEESSSDCSPSGSESEQDIISSSRLPNSVAVDITFDLEDGKLEEKAKSPPSSLSFKLSDLDTENPSPLVEKSSPIDKVDGSKLSETQKLYRAAEKLMNFFESSNFKMEKGVFRVSANQDVLLPFSNYVLNVDSQETLTKEICNKFKVDAHLVACSLKSIYKKINLFGRNSLYDQTIEVGKKLSKEKLTVDETVSLLKNLVTQLNLEEQASLKHFIELLYQISEEKSAEMPASNLAIALNDTLCLQKNSQPASVPSTQHLTQPNQKKNSTNQFVEKFKKLKNFSLKTSKSQVPVVTNPAQNKLQMNPEAALAYQTGDYIKKVTESLIVHCHAIFL